MLLRILHSIIIINLCLTETFGQTENYYVRRAPFSSDAYDEFSPVFYRNGIVFCSNRYPKIFSGYYTSKKKPFFRIYFADTTKNHDVSLLTGVVNSNLNNGPATFNRTGDTIYFSRNLIVEGNYRDIAGPQNKLGLYSAVLRNGNWEDIQELRFNDRAWNVTTPSLSPDGKRLFFASDKAEGSGGSDIYFSQWKNGYWDNPINLGPIVNTPGNEAYPFVNTEGELFFSSDGHPGKGGKDIFFTKEVDSSWTTPVALAAPVNSTGNDFGFITDNTISMGYFSSDRSEKLDIYYFKTVYPQFLYCKEQKPKRYCYTFMDDEITETDPLLLRSRWDFGNGKTISGYSASYCFEKPGKYTVKQDVIDRETGRVVFTRQIAGVEVIHDGLPYIISDDYAIAGNKILFKSEDDAQGFESLAYYWDFNKSGAERNKEVDHTFNEIGAMTVSLMADIREKATGKTKKVCVSKKIKVVESSDKIPKSNGNNISDEILQSENGNIIVRKIYSAASEISKRAYYAVQIMVSEKKIPVNDMIFNNIGSQYQIRAIWIPEKKVYSYIIAEELSFMAAFHAYREAVSSGFKNAIINTLLPQSAGEIDLWNFKRTYGTGSEKYFFNNSSSISPEAISILDRLVLLLKRNPGLKLMIVAYTEKTYDELDANDLSSKQAKSIMDYLINAGVDRERLSSTGFGGMRQVAENFPESEKIKNRRVDFLIID